MSSALLLLSLVLLPGQSADRPEPPADAFRPDPAWKPLGPSLWFDPQGRRLIVRARVVQTDAALEHLLCRTQTKEHESVLATDARPRSMHAGLLLAGAETGHPVRYRPEFQPPSGTPIAITLEWDQDGKTRRADAKDWVKDLKSGKPLEIDWVFAGSEVYPDPETQKPRYAADDGDVITVSNFVTAMLDLPIASSSSDEARAFGANTARIPPVGTRVTMILAPKGSKPTPKP